VLELLALIFSIIGVMLASIVLVEQQHLKRIVEHNKKEKTQSSATLLHHDNFKILLHLEQLNLLETEEKERIDKMMSVDTHFDIIEKYVCDISKRLTEKFKHSKHIVLNYISGMEYDLNLFRDDFNHTFLHEMNLALQFLKDWNWESNLINPKRLNDEWYVNLNILTITTHYDSFNKLNTKLEKLKKS